jgi:predicted metal-dependent phosphoesterase TrpH
MSISVEFHCHTNASKDSLTHPADLVSTARRKGIDRVIVTDHNSVLGARKAQLIDPDLIIIGEEIMTTKGEILAAFIKEEIPAFLTPKETVKRLKDQGAFISVSHPFDELRKGAWKEEDLLDILPLIDAIEVFNSRCMYPRFNERARLFAEEHNIAGTVGSDAHAGFELGTSLLLLEEFDGSDGLRHVLRKGKMKVRSSPWWVHFVSRYASTRRKIKS